jgi:cell division protein FtsZ
VTKPFSFEGMRRKLVAEQYTELLKEKVDTLITIPNDRLREVVDKKTSIVDAFRVVDDVLRQGVQGISDLITVPGLINLDFADVKTIMRDAGSSMMGIGMGTGENRAVDAAKAAVMSPLLEVNITGARGILFNVTGGSDLGLFEVNEAAEVIREAADAEANIIFGTVIDDRMRDEVKVTVIATGFDGTRKAKQPGRHGAESAGDVEQSLDDRSREILAEIERDREQRASLEEQMGTESPFARTTEREAAEPRPSERTPLPVRPGTLEPRSTYGEADLDIPSFLRRKND